MHGIPRKRNRIFQLTDFIDNLLKKSCYIDWINSKTYKYMGRICKKPKNKKIWVGSSETTCEAPQKGGWIHSPLR